jgi:hypothetical protein
MKKENASNVQVSGYINHERKKAKDVLAYNQQHLIKL